MMLKSKSVISSALFVFIYNELFSVCSANDQTTCMTGRGSVSIGLMGSIEPINFEKRGSKT